MRKIKILHIVSTSQMSGAERLAYNIIKSLNTKFDFSIICGDGELAVKYKEVTGSVFIVKKRNYINKLIAYYKIIEFLKPDIIHAHDNKASLIGFIVLNLSSSKPKLISHVHNMYPYLVNGGLYKIIDSIARPLYSANVFCGENVREFYMKHSISNKKLKNIFVVNNATDIEANLQYAEKEIIDAPFHNVRVGYVGRLVDQKGLMEFFIAIKEIGLDRNIGISIIGSGSEENKLIDFVNKNLQSQNIKFLGFKNNPYAWIKCFDFLILPSKYEGLPVIVLEAMSLRIPVLAMDVGSMKEVISNNINGWLVENGNYSEFVCRINQLINSKDSIRQIGQNAQKTIIEKYDIKDLEKKIYKIYKFINEERL